MAESPWRCSQCGTINEPVANSCRTCGRWPSLFDLQDSVVEDEEYAPQTDAGEPQAYVPDVFEPETIQTETFEPEPFEPEPVAPRRRFDPPPTQPIFEEGEAEGRRPRWVSWLVPLAFLAYFVISYVFSSR